MSNSNQKLPTHFRDFIVSLNSHEVEYMLIGGYAIGAYGHIRATSDLGIFINATDENADRMIQACISFGIEKESLSKEMFLVQKMIGIGQPPFRIKVLKKLDTVDFSHAYQRVMKRAVDGIDLNVVGLNDLALLKKAAIKDRNKSRDSEDLSFLNTLIDKIKNA